MRVAVRCALAVGLIAASLAAGPAGISQAAATNPNPSAQSFTFGIVAVQPGPDDVVGVAHPVVITFGSPVTDRRAAERAVDIRSTPPMTGTYEWVDSTVLQWSPDQFWPAHTTVALSVGGRPTNFATGPAVVGVASIADHTFTVTIDGQVVRQIPVSMGRSDSVTVDGKEISFVTPSGIYVAQEKYPVKQMSSASYGLPTDYSLGYDSQIPLAVRLSNSGIFAHSAPWSVADQGVRNVSHGCINLPPANAAKIYENVDKNTPVIVY